MDRTTFVAALSIFFTYTRRLFLFYEMIIFNHTFHFIT